MTLMKTIFTLIACLFLTSFAHAEDYYAKLLGGLNFAEGAKHQFRRDYIFSGALGYQSCYGIAFEAEYAFRRNKIKRFHYFGQDFSIPGSLQSSSYMANALWDFECGLFLGGGIGYDVQQFHVKEDSFRWDDNKKGFSWQLLAGLRYPLCNGTRIGLEYQLHKGPLKNIYNHSIGLTYELY